MKSALTAVSIITLSKIFNDPILALAAKEADKILKGQAEPIHIIWIQAQACSGCSISLLNAVEPSIIDVLNGELKTVGEVALDFHPTIMAQWGVEHVTGTEDESVSEWDAMQILENVKNGTISPYVLVTEGAFPDETSAKLLGGYWCSIGESDGSLVTGTEFLQQVAQNAAAVVAVGACASYGGIPSGTPNPTNTTGTVGILGSTYRSQLQLPVINVPGCPPAGDWIIKTLAHLLLTVKGLLPAPELDEYNRPIFLYKYTVHEQCARGVFYASGRFIDKYGEPYCLFEKGCKGPIVRCPVPTTKYVEGVGACTPYGSPCIGCTHPSFPDPPTSPFLEAMPAISVPPTELLTAAALAGAIFSGTAAYSLHKKRKKIIGQKVAIMEEAAAEKTEG